MMNRQPLHNKQSEQVDFLYCIDFPDIPGRKMPMRMVRGWLVGQRPIVAIEAADAGAGYEVHYGMERPDVAKHFAGFPQSHRSGFEIRVAQREIMPGEDPELNLTFEGVDGSQHRFKLRICLQEAGICSDTWFADNEGAEKRFAKAEIQLRQTLQRHPWLTIRTDITNKCNLKCIMCHYREDEIRSQPARNITAEELLKQLDGIGHMVKHIMLSCGFEPLMSKHFGRIVRELRLNYPHMEIGLCTNGMLMNSQIRKDIMESGVTHLLFSFDGATRDTLEKIRVGASYRKILANIMALRDMKANAALQFPLMYMDYVLMQSNIHEAPVFVDICAELGIQMIDFRHLVGNIFFSSHPEMLSPASGNYNHYREMILQASRTRGIEVRLPEPFSDEQRVVQPLKDPPGLQDFRQVTADPQTEMPEIKYIVRLQSGNESDFWFLKGVDCLRPFNEIMITGQEKISPCAFYTDAAGMLSAGQNLQGIFFGEIYASIRRRKLLGITDHNCMNCPVKLRLLPTEVTR